MIGRLQLLLLVLCQQKLVYCLLDMPTISLAIPMALDKVNLVGCTIWNHYAQSLYSKPLMTNMLTAASLTVVSDSLSQRYERRIVLSNSANTTNNSNVKHSFYRSFCMSIYGSTIYGLFITHWFTFLNSLIPQESLTFQKALLKVLINQIIMSPTLNTLFFAYVALTRDPMSSWSNKVSSLKLKLEKDLIPTMARSCVYWGIAQFINFYWISVHFGKQYQLLYTNIAFVIWTVYISYIGYRKVIN